jgi:starvation-inducible DNA-binding protein
MFSTKKNNSLLNAVSKVIVEADQATNMAAAKSMLVNRMRIILADAYILYFRSHNYHWNIEGSNFPQYHKFLDDVYNELFERLDHIAEQIRTLGAYTPTSFREMINISNLNDSATIGVPSAESMFSQLLSDNEKYIANLNVGYKLAETAGEAGLSNFLQDLIDKHKKLSWMITSTLQGA